MIDYYLFQTLFILLLSNSLCLEDLFLSKNCHKAILKRPHHKGSSWNKVIKVHENELRLCQKNVENQKSNKLIVDNMNQILSKIWDFKSNLINVAIENLANVFVPTFVEL